MNIGSYYVRRVLADGTIKWFTGNGWTATQANARAFKARRGADKSMVSYWRRLGFMHYPTTQTATGDWFANH